MINIDDAKHLESVINEQKQVNGYKNYLEDVLKPAIFAGNRDKLEKLPIGFSNGKPLGYIIDDVWELTDYFYPNSGETINLIFRNKDDTVIERNLKFELKILMLSMLWLSPKYYSLKQCKNTLNSLKNFTGQLVEDGKNSFSALTYDFIDEWIQAGVTTPDFRVSPTYGCLNKLIIEKDRLPYPIYLKGTLTAKKFDLSIRPDEQYVAIPYRIYKYVLDEASAMIENIYKDRNELYLISQELVSYRKKIDQDYAAYVYKTGKINHLNFSTKGTKGFLDAYNEIPSPTLSNISDLIDKFHIAYRSDRTYKFSDYSPEFVFKGKKIPCEEAREMLVNYTRCCSFIILALTGMRVDELYALHWVNGVNEEDIEGQNVITLNCDISKITKTSQARQVNFVTTLVGKKAYEILNDIMSPLRRLRKNHEQSFFHSNELSFSALAKSSVGNGVTKWVNKVFSDLLILTEEDMKYLTISDPEQKKFKLDDIFLITPHQLRRSFAYYLIGYELLSFPQLKQQFSHFSLAMTRYYAKNASKFQKFVKSSTYDEIRDERIKQQAQMYLNIYMKLFNNERVSGGKGKEFAKKRLEKNSNNQFTDRRLNDMLSLSYWENQIRRKKRHLHVVAPGIICTSSNCSLRTEVNLLECEDCDNDYILDAVYAESRRKEAEINMLYDIENDALTPSSASESYITISAAERIMDSLEMDYEPVSYPKEVSDMLISFIEV